MKKVLIPLPKNDFDPTEAAVPWKVLSENGVQIIFATSDGQPAACDEKMLNGTGLGIFAPLLKANKAAIAAYAEMSCSESFLKPLKWSDIRKDEFDGLVLPGGHAPGMKEYLESSVLQKLVADFFAARKPVGAICHGVVLAARSRNADGRSVLYGKKTTSLLAAQELSAWALTCLWLGSYYRTYPQTVEAEVKAVLKTPEDFLKGPLPVQRDSASDLSVGFCVCDDRYISARWPGDAYVFSNGFLKILT